MLYQIIDCYKSFGSQDIFQNLSFEIKGKEKIAVVGKNGCGKSTLLKIIAGLEQRDSGEIISDKKCTIGYLEQVAFSDEDIPVEDEFEKSFEEIHHFENKLKEMEVLMQTDYNQDILEKYGRLLQRFESMGGYTYKREIETIFTKFGFPITDREKKINEFSGGQKTKLAFIKLLLSKPDILLLDEPTNHLDLETIEWLEGYVKHYPKAVIVVSHDRMFLDNVVDIVYEIENRTALRYSGNYSYFVNTKRDDIIRQNKEYANQQKEIKRLEELIEKFRYKVNKAKFAQSKIKYLERMTVIEERKEDTSTFHANFSSRIKGAKKALIIKELSVGYNQELCKVSLEVYNGDRIAVIGKNGTGKSTFVKTLVGNLKPLKGSYSFGKEIEIGYFDQEVAQLNSNNTVIEELWDRYPYLGKTQICNTLGCFRFSGDDALKQVNILSGGEKVRLTLAKLLLKHDNFLILDEPTNHLDIRGKEALEKSLREYDGTILFVSHDRYFISHIATAILEIDNNKVNFYPMKYQEYLVKRQSVV
ncbi:ATP-binding cassette domain-containing protein [Anaerocolumna sedimenticola]|uniref:ATP-binding cassette domain-containing protein n=1 Tax=Anaerocolumna sedimenticola TaxID=2696063 RepID=A0A6P1TKD6_9FIRM|nr:ABC-F family ATP-binding cassette domain-containing protein [Anaerocolumna sedimenticola]QHQ61544.1 ATP-binding cassette domain-containing protein [Anaerocolumna sedimenticola]